jgi:Zn-dependent protease
MNNNFPNAKVTPGNEEDVAVLLELSQLQNQKSSWTGMIILFGVSLVLFIGAGAGRWSMNYLIILLGVLFVHEMGHYLAMRAFHYKNVKMFFIPFFGAAVSGQHFNVPGWKKVIVSLMGPVPGIVLGVIVGGAGLVMHEPILVKIALVSMFLNGFNLLPVLPLDGGWVFHAILFSRHYMLDIVFRVLAAVALIASPLVLHTRVLPFVGILMLIALPVAFRNARIAAALKQQGFPPISDDDQQIPPATAGAIIAEVRKSSPQRLSNKVIAQQVLQIFEMLNARPPGWGASVGLLFVQGVSVVMALVFGLAFFVAQTGSLLNFISAAAAQPKHSLDLKYTDTWGARAPVAPDQEGIIMVATFPSAARAGMMYCSLTNRVADNMSLTRFGDSLLLAMPAGKDDLRVHWFSVLTNATKDVFVDSTNYHAAFTLYCVAPDTNTAETIVREMNGYFRMFHDYALIPPWRPQETRSPEQRAQNELARQTYLKLQDLQTLDEPQIELENKRETALKEGDTAGALKLERQMGTLVETEKNRGIARLRDGERGPVDTNVIDSFILLNDPENVTNAAISAKIRRQLAQRMGQLPFLTNGGSFYDNRYSANIGMASRAGLLVTISYVSFDRIDSGPKAMAAWLQGKGCIGFKYDFLPGLASGGDD